MINRIFNLVFILLSLISAEYVLAFKLPDTGQTLCYDSSGNEISCSGTGQDGEYNINPMSYTDNGNGTVIDNNTGLMWQQQDDGITRSWDEAGTYCGSLNLGGKTGWRLPSKKELITLVDYSIALRPAINAVFTNTKQSNYWSSTPYAEYPWGAWVVQFFDGAVYGYFQNDVYVRCVRGYETPGPALVNNGNGITVTDNRTGLIWQQGEAGAMTWDSALSYCKGLSLTGRGDWRLPNIKELESITSDLRYNPAIDTGFFPNAYAANYWSSTIYYVQSIEWIEYFYSGYIPTDYMGNFNYVRCVRGGQFGSLSRLNIALFGDGTGTVVTNPTSVDCGSGCSTLLFPSNSVVAFEATSTSGSSVFSGWGGDADCLDGQVTMDADKNCTAKFSTCAAGIARIGLSSYQTIADAYGAIPSSAPVTIELIAYNTSEVLTLSDNKNITLHGGFDCSYTLQPFSFTTIAGPLTIAGGSVVVDSIALL